MTSNGLFAEIFLENKKVGNVGHRPHKHQEDGRPRAHTFEDKGGRNGGGGRGTDIEGNPDT